MTDPQENGERVRRIELSGEGIPLVYDDGKYPYPVDAPRPASACEIDFWERLRAAEEKRDEATVAAQKACEGFGLTWEGSILDMARRMSDERTELKLALRAAEEERDKLQEWRDFHEDATDPGSLAHTLLVAEACTIKAREERDQAQAHASSLERQLGLAREAAQNVITAWQEGRPGEYSVGFAIRKLHEALSLLSSTEGEGT